MDLILSRVELFEDAPFTIQRLCELLLEPAKHYTSTDKYMRALLKNLLVVSGMHFPQSLGPRLKTCYFYPASNREVQNFRIKLSDLCTKLSISRTLPIRFR